MTLPLALTFLRILLIPALIAAFYLPVSWAPWLASGIFFVAAVTDWLDGYLARLLNQTSPFGAFLDPVADKLMVAVALVLLVEAYPSAWMVIPAAVIIGREIAISALREWMAEVGKRAHVAVSVAGKVKTISQMLAITLLLIQTNPAGVPVVEGGFALLYIAAILTLVSMVIYLTAAWRVLMAPGEGGA